MAVGAQAAHQFRDVFSQVIPFKATVNLASIADQAEGAADITVAGAELGDMVVAAFGVDEADLVTNFYVSAANVVTVTAGNLTTGAVDLASTTVTGFVLKAGRAFEAL